VTIWLWTLSVLPRISFESLPLKDFVARAFYRPIWNTVIDYIHTAFFAEFSSFTAHLDLQRPHVPITNHNGEFIETVTSNVPDRITVYGTLASSDIPIDVRYRRGQSFKGSPGFEWIVTGEVGEIKISGPGPSLQALDLAYQIEVYDFEHDEVENVKWEEKYPNLPVPARNVGRLYELFAKGDQTLYPDFDDAVLRHTELDAVFQSSDEDKRGPYI
jgi:predicted dehydrogenase